MKEPEPPLLPGSHQAHGAELKAIENLLAKTIATPAVRFEVSRRDHILYVFITTPPPDQAETYAEAVYEVIASLQLINVSQLTVLDGCDRPLTNRWHQSFLLPTPELEWVGAEAPEAAIGSPETERLSPTLAFLLEKPSESPETVAGLPETEGLSPPSAALLNKSREFSQASVESPEGLIESPEGLFESPEGLLESPEGLIESPEGLPNLVDQSATPADSQPVARGGSADGPPLPEGAMAWAGMATEPSARLVGLPDPATESLDGELGRSEGWAESPEGLVKAATGADWPTPRAGTSAARAIAPLPPALWVEPMSYGGRTTTASGPGEAKGRSLRRWGWLVLGLGLVALGLGAGAGYAYWRNRQQVTAVPQTAEALDAPTSPEPPPPSSLALAPVFTKDHLADLVPTVLQAPTTLTINAVGDIIPGTDYRTYRLPQDWQYLFRSIQHQLNQADLVFGNFESTLTEVPTSAKDTSRAMTFAFRTPPWYASVLKEAGFDILSVANNHSFDFGEQGFSETIGHIEAAGMKAVGRKGQILSAEVDNTTVAFIAFSYLNTHNTVQDLDAAAALVQEANRQADIVVVSFHAGKEGTDAIATRDQTEYFHSENRGNVVQFSRTVIDHGADLVLGHGPHVPRALELYNNKLIAYSLGNFLGYRTLSTVGPLGVSLILTTNLNAQGDFVSGRIIPVALDPNGVPYLDDYFQSVILIRTYTRQDFPQTPLVIDDLGYIWRSQ